MAGDQADRWPPKAYRGRDGESKGHRSVGLSLRSFEGLASPRPGELARVRSMDVVRGGARRGVLAAPPGWLSHANCGEASLLRVATLRASPAGGWRGAAPPLTLRFRPATGAAGGGGAPTPEPRRGGHGRAKPRRGRRLGRPDPRRTVGRELGRDRRGLEDPPVGGSLAHCVQRSRSCTPNPCRARENRSHGHSGRFGGGLAESKAVGSTVAHELDPRKGRSTPGFELPAEELDILAADDRAAKRGRGALSTAERLAVAARPACAIR